MKKILCILAVLTTLIGGCGSLISIGEGNTNTINNSKD